MPIPELMPSADRADEFVVLRVRGLRKTFGTTEVLRGISFEQRRGEVLTIIGASGSGKSTLLRCLNHLEAPSDGEIWLDGEPIGFVRAPDGSRLPPRASQIVKARRRIGMVFQQFNLWPHLTALGNVCEGLRQVLRLSKDAARARAENYLVKVGMLEHAARYPAMLSGGQQQRVAIARALAMEPELMLFDEATSSLDPELTAEVMAVMRRLAASGTTMIVVTHEMAFARDASDRVMFLNDGLIEEEGPPARMFGAPQSPRLAQFLSHFPG
jgi:ABC-type histidine transport system ATPase subunit